jgi:hypothetical protein
VPGGPVCLPLARGQFCEGSPNYTLDGADWVLAGLIVVMSVVFWPLLAVAGITWLLIQGIRRSPIGPAIKWFYTLDRQERKELFAK